MGITYHKEVVQGSESWHSMRCGVLTASEMHLIVTPTLKVADNDKTRAHLYELLAQRITGYVEPQYVSDAMLRGQSDEIAAGELYATNYAPIERIGFVTNDKWGFTIGYSPDALVGEDGLIECKSRAQKHQIKTIVDYVDTNIIDPNYMIQVQTGLLVTGRKWCDLVSYCGGLPMATVRVFPHEDAQKAIIESATAFEKKLADKLETYNVLLKSKARLIPTERTIEQEMHL